jgi:Flp pilus assembly pilin Flp
MQRILPLEGRSHQEAIMLLRSKGQGLAEYALILALIAILAITALIFLSGQINTILSTIGKAL